MTVGLKEKLSGKKIQFKWSKKHICISWLSKARFAKIWWYLKECCAFKRKRVRIIEANNNELTKKKKMRETLKMWLQQ